MHETHQVIINLLKNENLFIAITDVTLSTVAGHGHFGRVYKSMLYNDINNTVAVKVLNNYPNEEMINTFLREVVIMKDLRHENIVSLIGVSIDANKSPLIILEFIPKGDLKRYITDVEPNLGHVQLLKFCVDIAKGMQYLVSKQVIHRDLAARNCFVDDNLNVKIGDFGLSRDITDKNYYRCSDSKAALPWKWMAMESMETKKFTHESDVWTFGIVVFELISRGWEPYGALSYCDVKEMFAAGARLWKPDNCPEVVYELMLRCWATEPSDRPMFGQLVNDLTEIICSLQ